MHFISFMDGEFSIYRLVNIYVSYWFCVLSFHCTFILLSSSFPPLFDLFLPSSSPSDLAAKMWTVRDPADFLSPPQRSIWDITQVRSVLGDLTVDNSNIFFAKPSLVYSNETTPPSIHGDCTHPSTTRHSLNVSSADLVEPYFGTLYALYCTEEELIQKWENPDIPQGNFSLPTFQTYTPHDLSLLPLPEDHSKVPQLVHDDTLGECKCCVRQHNVNVVFCLHSISWNSSPLCTASQCLCYRRIYGLWSQQ